MDRHERNYGPGELDHAQRFQHDFRTTLSIIDFAARRIERRLEDGQPAEIERYTQTLRAAVVRATELVDRYGSELSDCVPTANETDRVG